MKTTFHFSSAENIPVWQKEETLRRKEHIKKHPESLLDFDVMIAQLEQKLSGQNK